MGLFFTIKSNNDSTVFNFDSYAVFFRKLFGIRTKRYIVRKEVIIDDPDYEMAANMLSKIVADSQDYRRTHKLRGLPNYINLFFRNGQDEKIASLSEMMEYVVETLANSKDRHVLKDLNALPVLDSHAHTAPFRNRKLNILAGALIPVGVILTFRVSYFRRRLRKDLRQIVKAAGALREHCIRLSA
jgi:lipopolysaccharide export system permease protein